jgi:hypothetical protein
MTELAKTLSETLYPDLIEAGGLHEAVTRALNSSGSDLKATTVPGFIPYARVEQGSRSTQVYIAAEQRLFTLEFWYDGIAYGNGATPDIGVVAEAIQVWIVEAPQIASMRGRFGFFKPTGKGEAHEAGTLVEYQWESLLRSWSEHEPNAFSPRPLIEAARLRPELRQLFPYTSLYKFCLSRTTGVPYTRDCPHALALGNGLYRAYSANYVVVTMRHADEEYRVAEHEILGEGTAEEVLDLLVVNLPPGCGPAVNGTAVDLANKAGSA